MNELNMGSAISHKAQSGKYPPGVNADLPPKQVVSIPGGKELPSSANPTGVNKPDDNGAGAPSKLHQPDSRQTEKTVEDLNKVAISLQRDLNFKVDDETGKSIITVTDSATQKVIRQIPSEEIVELAKNLLSMVQSAETPNSNAPTGSSTGSLLNITA